MEYIFIILTFPKLLTDVKKRIKKTQTQTIISDALSLLNQKIVCSPLKAVTSRWFVFTTSNMQRKQVDLMATSQHRLESFSSPGTAIRFSGTDWDQKQ